MSAAGDTEDHPPAPPSAKHTSAGGATPPDPKGRTAAETAGGRAPLLPGSTKSWAEARVSAEAGGSPLESWAEARLPAEASHCDRSATSMTPELPV